MNAGRFFLMSVAVAAMAGCSAMLNPTLTKEERAILDFNVNGLKLGSPSGQLAIFPQVQRIPIKLGGYDVYEVFNATPNISEIKAWFLDNKCKRIELRYFNGGGTNTLARAGGWDGIRNYLFEKYGPPSRFGPDVPVLATKGQWNVKYAKFNGEWIFSRVKRQLNYIVMSDASGGIGVVTVMDTTPVVVPRMVAEPAPAPAAAANPGRAPEEVVVRAPNPGF